MVKGVRTKDIRDFEKVAGKLNDIVQRIREYNPEAGVYATPGQLNLMSGYLFDAHASSQDEQDTMLVTSVALDNLETGDW